MKNLITLLLLVVSTTTFSQIKKIEANTETIEIGKITPGGIKTIYSEKVNDEYYLIHYKDAKYTKIDEWKSFTINNEQDFNDFFDLIIEGFNDIPNDAIMLDTPNGFIWLSYIKVFGKPYARIGFSTSNTQYANVGFSNQYNERQIRRLFAK